MKNLLIHIFFSLFISFNLFAQQKIERVEIETNFRSESYRVVPMGQSGAVLFSQGRANILSNTTPYQFSYFDKNLKKIWEQEIEVSNWTDLEGYDVDGKSLYLLFHRFSSDAYDFYKVDTEKQKVELISMYSVKKLELDDFIVMDGNAFVSGLSKRTPVLLHFDLNGNDKSKVRILPTSSTKKAEIEFLEKDTVNNLVTFNYTNWRGNESTMVLQSFEPNGNMASEIALPHRQQ